MYLALKEGKNSLWKKSGLLLPCPTQAAMAKEEEPVLVEKGHGRGHGRGKE